MKISKKGLIAVVCLLISCAIIVPWFFPQISNDDKIGWLTMTYRVNEYDFRNGTEMGFTEVIYNLTYVASRNNMEIVLSTQTFNGYPLATNVSSWELDDVVEVGTEMAVIVEETIVGGRECWTCELDQHRFVSYDVLRGLLVQANWTLVEQLAQWIYETQRVVQLVGTSHDIPGEGYPSQEGIIIAGIFIELAIVVWLVPNHLRRKQHQP